MLEAGEEQGLVPDGWDSSRAAPFVANFVVVALVAPIVEELTYRGLGFAAVRDSFGVIAAVVVTSLAFGLAHGLVVALPVLTIFGAILAWLRFSTDEHLSADRPPRDLQRRGADRGGVDVKDADRLAELRARVAENDGEIVALVNERLRLVREIWALKADRGTARLDPERERQLRAQLDAANDGPLSTAGLERLVTELLALTKSELEQG